MISDSKKLLGRFQRVVSLPSVSSTDAKLDSSNAGVIDYLSDEFEALGFSCEQLPCPGAPGKLNLIATLGSGPGGLVMAGHTDTVPYNEALWTSDPFKLSQRNGRLFGLGITDMKGFFPLVMEAVTPLRGETFREPLIVLATADEESSMRGARSLAEMGRPRARAAVIGEPTGLRPVRAHKGMMMESIELLGQSGHSSNPALGKNALEAMHTVIADLLAFREELRSRYASSLFEIPYPTLNLGHIHGGDNPNRICGDCRLDFDIRLTPGMEQETLRGEIMERVRQITDPLGIEARMNTLFDGVPAFFTDDDSSLLASVEKLTGHDGISVAFATEGPYLKQLGMDTIICGPGNIDQAHQPDEYLAEDACAPCVKLLRELIVQRCLTESEHHLQ